MFRGGIFGRVTRKHFKYERRINIGHETQEIPLTLLNARVTSWLEAYQKNTIKVAFFPISHFRFPFPLVV